jgi:hypothetical protein
MKQFMFLFKGGKNAVEASAEEMQESMQKWMAWIEDLSKQGLYKSGEALENEGKTVHSDRSVTDAPLTEFKELIGGYFVVTAESFDAACQMAKDCPVLDEGGSVVVRQVMELNM